jgi:RNA polymerase sigma factor (sigma-70 family)
MTRRVRGRGTEGRNGSGAPAAVGPERPMLRKRLSDEHLAGRLAGGEASAFDELYRRYAHRLAAYAGHLLADPVAGDDVAQTALFKAYQSLRAGRLPDAVRPWLYRIAHNAAIDVAVRRRELPSDDLPEVAGHGSAPVAPLLAAIASLTEHQRRVYAARELRGLRIDETARELGLTAGQVEQALFAARNRLAEHLVFGERDSPQPGRRPARPA